MEDKPNDTEEPEGHSGREEEHSERKRITQEMIAERAYLISQSDRAGSDEENWLRAEQELRAELEG